MKLVFQNFKDPKIYFTNNFATSMADPKPKLISRPAIRLPIKISKTAFQKGISNKKANKAPVQAPVPGRGIAMKMTRKTEPHFCILWPCFSRVSAKSLWKKFSKNLECLIKKLETGPRSFKIKKIGIMLPISAQKKAASIGKCKRRPNGMPPRSSTIGSIDVKRTRSSGGRYGMLVL